MRTINSKKALAMLSVGDRVRINHHASSRYLHGIHGIVVELDEHAAVVCVRRDHRRLPRRRRATDGLRGRLDEDANFPCPGTIACAEVEVLRVGQGNGRRELIATCQRAGRQHDIALLDIDINADPATSRLARCGPPLATHLRRSHLTKRLHRPEGGISSLTGPPADVSRLIGNLFNAINIDPVLATPHELLVNEQRWIAANPK